MPKAPCWLLLSAISLMALTTTVMAKRLPPKPVHPIIADGIRYSTAGDGRDQYVVVTDDASGKELWRIKVCHTQIKPWLEEDVQEIFITDLRLRENVLLVRDKRSRCYSVDIKAHGVRRSTCAMSFEY